MVRHWLSAAVLLLGCVLGTQAADPVAGTSAPAKETRLAQQKEDSGLSLELCMDDVPQAWHAGQPYMLRLRLVNGSEKYVVLPEPWPSQDGVKDNDAFFFLQTQLEQILPGNRVFCPGGLEFPLLPGMGTQVVAPGASIERIFEVVFPTPGTYGITAKFVNSTDWIHVSKSKTHITKEGQNTWTYSTTYSERVKKPEIWICSVTLKWPKALEVDKEVPAELQKNWQAANDALAAGNQEEAAKLLSAAISGDNWHSAVFCYRVLDDPKWAACHETARDRIAALADMGLLDGYWDRLLSDLNTSEAWRTRRRALIPIVERLADSSMLGVTILSQGIHVATDEQYKAARKLLEEWAKGRSLLSRDAGAALKRLEESEASRIEAVRE